MQAKTNRFILSLVLAFFMNNTAGHSVEAPLGTPEAGLTKAQLIEKCARFIAGNPYENNDDTFDIRDFFESEADYPELFSGLDGLETNAANFIPEATHILLLSQAHSKWHYSEDEQNLIADFFKRMRCNMECTTFDAMQLSEWEEFDDDGKYSSISNEFGEFGYLCRFMNWLTSRDPQTEDQKEEALTGFVYYFGDEESNQYTNLDTTIDYLLSRTRIDDEHRETLGEIKRLSNILLEETRADEVLRIKLEIIFLAITAKYANASYLIKMLNDSLDMISDARNTAARLLPADDYSTDDDDTDDDDIVLADTMAAGCVIAEETREEGDGDISMD